MTTIKDLGGWTRSQLVLIPRGILGSSGAHGTAECHILLSVLTQAAGLEPLAGTGTGISAGDSDGARARGCLLPSYNAMLCCRARTMS